VASDRVQPARSGDVDAAEPGDTGWHIDMSFGTAAPDFMSWRANIHSSGRLLLMLFVFSDVGERDAPTLIRVGSRLRCCPWTLATDRSAHSRRWRKRSLGLSTADGVDDDEREPEAAERP